MVDFTRFPGFSPGVICLFRMFFPNGRKGDFKAGDLALGIYLSYDTVRCCTFSRNWLSLTST